MSKEDSSNDKPAISIVCSSFNHEKLIPAFLESLSRQTDGNFEAIIIDDASTDDNLSVVRSSRDPRIRVIAREANRGYCASLNEGIIEARADIVAFIATDDLLNPNYVERVVATFADNPLAIAAYVELDRMGPDGASLNMPCRLPVGHARGRVLRDSFLGQNQLPSPGMAIRRDFAMRLLLPEGTAQFSDWMLQNRILMNGDIVMLEEQLVRYRVSNTSLSAESCGRAARDSLETRIMMDDFLKIKDMAFLRKVFPEEIKPYASLPSAHMPYVLGRLALLSDIHEKRCWGYEIIMRHLSEPGMAESLRRHAGFTHKDLMGLVPTEAAARTEEIGQLHRRLRRLRRWAMVLAAGLALALWVLFT
jgi:glycosyltransferase involved in cell wall biosynthesis